MYKPKESALRLPLKISHLLVERMIWMNENTYRLDGNVIIKQPRKITTAVNNGMKIFLSDLEAVFGTKPVVNNDSDVYTLLIKYSGESEEKIEPESYSIT